MTPNDSQLSEDASSEPAPFALHAIDRQVLSMTDDQFTLHTWDEVASLISQNKLEDLKRKPSQLRKYIAWSTGIKARYGSMGMYIMKEKLRWEPLNGDRLDKEQPRFEVANVVPFRDERDYVVLRNDWPYALEEGVEHLVVWLKTPLGTQGVGGDLTDGSRTLVFEFVEGKFERRLGRREDGGKRILWFKNWGALQSVRAVDHVHIFVRDVDEDLLREWTEGDRGARSNDI